MNNENQPIADQVILVLKKCQGLGIIRATTKGN
jgi:hypothetical protein